MMTILDSKRMVLNIARMNTLITQHHPQATYNRVQRRFHFLAEFDQIIPNLLLFCILGSVALQQHDRNLHPFRLYYDCVVRDVQG
jgi:hypothetical protein